MHHKLLLAHKALKDKFKLLQAELSSKGTDSWADISHHLVCLGFISNFLFLLCPCTAGTEAKVEDLQKRVSDLLSKP